MPSFASKTPITNLSIGPKFGPKIFAGKKPPGSAISFGMERPKNLPVVEDDETNLPRLINYNADQGGCALWRTIWPSEYLLSYKKATIMNLYQLVLEPYFYKTVNAVKFQRQCKNDQIKLIEHIKKIKDSKKSKNGEDLKILWEVDDLVAPADDIPKFNKSRDPFDTPEILENLKKLKDLIDEFVVVSPYMKQHYMQHAGWEKVTVIPNYLPFTWLRGHYNFDRKMKEFEQNKQKPRIGYIGSASHFDVKNSNGQKDDFHHVFDFIVKTIDKYQWVFVGGYPLRLHPYVKSGQVEFHKWVPILELHEKVRELNLQATIAPLHDCSFNRAKSDIKLMESASVGVPCICQDLDPYAKALYKFNTGEEMLSQIDAALTNYEWSVENSYNLTNGRWLHEHLDEHLLVYTTEFGDPSRDKFFNLDT